MPAFRAALAGVVSGVLALAVITACGSGGTSSTSKSGSASATTTIGSTSVASIVGRWEQMHTCPNLVHAFKKAGLEALAPQNVAGGGPVELNHDQLIAKAKKLKTQKNLCMGAWKPYRHYHFFTADGRFGSLDQNLQQVDDDHYKVVGHTLVFGKNKFRYRITDNGNTLTLEPVITSALRDYALAHPFGYAAPWMVSVAYTGSTWKRVPCDQWC
jgi:hypothetical protein